MSEREMWAMGNGTVLAGVHPAEGCTGNCPLHNPSEHPLKDAPLHWRSDWGGFFERICQHGIGHPDPDGVAFRKSQGREGNERHGCDRCCVRAAGERQE